MFAFLNQVLNQLLRTVVLTVVGVAAPSAALYLIYDDNNDANVENVVLTVRDADNPEIVLATITATSDTPTGQASIRVDNVTTNTSSGQITGDRNVLISATVTNSSQGGNGATNQVEFGGETEIEVDLSSTQPTYVVISKNGQSDVTGEVVNDLANASNGNNGADAEDIAIGEGLILQ